MMGRKAREMSALEVSRLITPGYHFVGGVSGLALQVSSPQARSWILRVMVGGKRRDMGLGGFPDVTLAGAKERARDARDKIRRGIDPIQEARSIKSALAAERASAITFEKAAESFIDTKSVEWKNSKHVSQWHNTLSTYAFPTIGKIHVKDIGQSHILSVLEPIWTTKTETATRVRGRIESVLDWAAVRGYRPAGDNPARWRGHLDKLLANPSKIAKVEHHAALPYVQIGAFMKELRKRTGTGARALEFAVLTAARSGEVRGATWNEIDFRSGVWTVPAERMKAGKEHRIPLPAKALDLLNGLPSKGNSTLLFPSSKETLLSDNTLTAILHRMSLSITAHGFRSTFRDWAAERTNFPREVAEMALAHAIENRVEAAYRRGDLFEKRRQLMQQWAEFCDDASAVMQFDAQKS